MNTPEDKIGPRFWTYRYRDCDDKVELDEWNAVVDNEAGKVVAYCESVDIAERIADMLEAE